MHLIAHYDNIQVWDFSLKEKDGKDWYFYYKTQELARCMQVHRYTNKFIIALPLRRFLFGPSSSSSSVAVSTSCSLRSISLLSVLVSSSSRSSSLTQQNKQKVTS